MTAELTIRCDGRQPLLSDLSKVADIARLHEIPTDARIESIALDTRVWESHGLDYSDLIIQWRRNE